MRECASVWLGLVLAVLMSAPPVYAQPAVPNRADVEKELAQRERDALDAYAKGDIPKYYQAIGWRGVVLDPLGTLYATTQANQMALTKIESFNVTNMQVHWLSDTSAVVTYDWNGKATRMGVPLPTRVYASTVWVNSNGTWVVAHHQESPKGS
jgi:hypothetical protein